MSQRHIAAVIAALEATAKDLPAYQIPTDFLLTLDDSWELSSDEDYDCFQVPDELSTDPGYFYVTPTVLAVACNDSDPAGGCMTYFRFIKS